jgi:hypothetical protein
VVVCTPIPPSVGVSVVVHQPTEALVLLLLVKGRGGTINPKLLIPHRHLPSKRVSRRRSVGPRSSSQHPLHDDASSPASPDRRFRVPVGFLPSAWGKVIEALLGRIRCRE